MKIGKRGITFRFVCLIAGLSGSWVVARLAQGILEMEMPLKEAIRFAGEGPIAIALFFTVLCMAIWLGIE